MWSYSSSKEDEKLCFYLLEGRRGKEEKGERTLHATNASSNIRMTEHGEETPLLLDGGDDLLREQDYDNEKNDVVEDVIDTLQLAVPIFISRVSFTGVSDITCEML